MKRGTIRDKFNLTEEMIAAKEDYVDQNETVDCLKDFITERFDIVPFVKKEFVYNNDFVSMYNLYLQMNKITDKNNSVKKITRRLKTLGINSKESHGKTKYLGLVEKEIIDEEDD